MPTVIPPPSRLAAGLPLVSTWVIWGLVGLSVVYWVMQWTAPEPEAVPAPLAQTAAAAGADASNLAMVLGAQDMPAAAPAPGAAPLPGEGIRLHGLAADPGGRGVALLEANGEPVKPYRVGDALANGWTLKALTSHTVRLVN
jgi:general secretion pathway protein C